MNSCCTRAFVAAFAVLGSAFASGLPEGLRTTIPSGPKNGIIPGYLMVKMRPAMSAFALKGLPKGTQYLHPVATGGWTMWKLPAGADPRVAAQGALHSPGVVAAEPLNRIYLLDPNDGDFGVEEHDEEVILNFGDGDPFFMRLWHLDDDNAVAGWSVYPNQFYTAATRPQNAPKIAIVDTGCDTMHPDFMNAGAITSDVHLGGQLNLALSRQFVLGEPDPTGSIEDVHGHGTHVTGLALAAANNGSFSSHGVIGIGYNAEGVILRVFDNSGTGTDADAAAAIVYAADNGVDVINLSLGTTNFSQVFQDAVTYAWQKGSLVVCAGNENGAGGGDLGPIYPAACSGALAVSANGPGYIPANTSYSGYGSYVDIAAPGGDIVQDVDFFMIQFVWSTAMRTEGYLFDLSNQGALYPPYHLNYAYLAGTSMACPQVSGAAALYMGQRNLRVANGFTNLKTYRALEKSAQGVMGAPYGGWELTQGYGSLDIYSLLTGGDPRGAQVGAIEGIVYSNATSIANVAVRAQKTSGGTTYTTTTQADGTYRFEALPPGAYKVWAAPFGQLKTKYMNVAAGSDLTGFDFWCGTYFNGDDTAPVVRFVTHGSAGSGSVMSLSYWAYDTETGVDKITARVLSNGNEIVPETEVIPQDGAISVAIPNPRVGPKSYTVVLKFTNGAGLVTTYSGNFPLR